MSIWTRRSATYDRGGGITAIHDPANILPVQGGGVRIKVEKITDTLWHTGGITTQDNWSFLYGRAEVRARLMKGKGLFDGFYLFEPKTHGEIDVFEAIDPACRNLQLTIHRAGRTQPDYANYEYVGKTDLSADYHRYGIEWSKEEVAWYLDGEKIWSQKDRVPQAPLYAYLTGCAGNWVDLPDATTPTTVYYDVDYLKVWQKK